MDRAAATFGQQLRHWRRQRGLTQLALALAADVSARHLSWLEAGKSEPSRAMVLRLAERLEVPLRERNALLVAAGFAPLFPQRAWDDGTAEPVRAQLQAVLDACLPWPALAVDRHWHLVAHNAMVPLLLQGVAPALLEPPVSVPRLMLNPQGLAARIHGLPRWRAHVLQRLQRQIAATGDPALVALLVELGGALPGGKASATDAGSAAAQERAPGELATPLVLDTPLGRLHFITTVTVFGSPNDVLLSELAIETLLPADVATAEALRGLQPVPG
jgi:transcriptional regulator with XRE-family HTH domain